MTAKKEHARRQEPLSGPPRSLDRRVRQQVVGRKHRFFAVVLPGFEETARGELAALGITEFLDPQEGVVGFASKLDGAYRVNLAARTVTRVLMRIAGFPAPHPDALQEQVAGIPWELYLRDGTRVSFQVASRRSRIRHAKWIEEEFRRGMAARLFRSGIHVAFWDAPTASGEQRPPQDVFVRFVRDRCRVSLDTSGGLLYRRGRKAHATRASLRETTAAAVLMEAGWPDYDVLVDPMCGAGTFSLEAHEIASGRLPGAGRDFAFLRWPAFRPAAFRHLEAELVEAARGSAAPRRIVASDIDPAAVAAAKGNLAEAGGVEVVRRDFLGPEGHPPELDISEGARCLVVLNPPYGKRLASVDVGKTYRRIGDRIRNHYRGGYAIIVPGLETEKVLSLPYDRKILFRNGGIQVSAIIRNPRGPGAS